MLFPIDYKIIGKTPILVNSSKRCIHVYFIKHFTKFKKDTMQEILEISDITML